MGATTKEKGLLKLVHPGRHVEVHKKPITAAEVMKKNPRHFVTRPDVFEYPWIVVKPESVLKLGEVFLIVPNHTLYNLIKAHKERNRPSPRHCQSPKNHAQRKDQKQNAIIKYDVGMSSKRRNQNWWLKQSLRPSCIGTNFQERDSFSDDRLRKLSKVDPWPKGIPKCKNGFEVEDRLVDASTARITSLVLEDSQISNAELTAIIPRSNNYELQEAKCKKLKSCLRKPDSVRRALQLKVSFNLPSDDERHQKQEKTSRTEFSGYSYSFTEFLVHSAHLVQT